MARERLLQTDSIFEAAFRQIEVGGLESLSMRGLGKSLGVEAMALYKYTGRREDLLAVLVDRLFAAIPIVVPTDQPRRDLEDQCLHVYRTLAARPRSCALLIGFADPEARGDTSLGSSSVDEGVRTTGQKAWLPLAETMLRSLESLIIEPMDRAYAFHTLLCYCIGQAQFARSRFGQGRLAQNGASTLSPHDSDFAAFGEVASVLDEYSPELGFELGLRALLDAIERRSPF